jgi:putative FmdB family regulatory protein
MPLYEYECESCGRRFERIQKFSDPPVASCPVCGGAVRKLLSSPAIQFKGSGFYITDYAKSGKAGDAEAAEKGGDKGATDKAAAPSTEPSGGSPSSGTSGAATETRKSEPPKSSDSSGSKN